MIGEKIGVPLSQQQVLALMAVAAGVAGALSTAPIGAWPRAVCLLAFVTGGVGSAVMCWLDVPPPAALAGVVGLSLGAVVAVSTSLAWLRGFNPTASCLTLATLVVASGGLCFGRGWMRGREAIHGEPDL